MHPHAIAKLQLLVRSIIGLETWLTGEPETDYDAKQLADDLARLQARCLVYQGVMNEGKDEEDGG